MTERAYLNGEFLPAAELLISPRDMGFLWGATVSEQLRTFRGQLFAWQDHEARLARSLEIVGIPLDLSVLEAAANQLVATNHGLLPDGHDLGLSIFVTPGVADVAEPQTTVAMHTFPLPFPRWAAKYTLGQRCRLVGIPQVSAACWPRELKCRSRMHYYLADREAERHDAEARAILLDAGFVNEASTANVLAYRRGEGLITPRQESVLPGVSLKVLAELANQLDIPWTYRDVLPQDLLEAEEVMLASTPFCLLPVSQLDERPFSERRQFQRLLDAWGNRVGMDLAAQARQFAAG